VIVHSRDGGKTWTQQQSGTNKALFAVSFIDNLHGWACGDESTWLSTANGGETWEVHRIECRKSACQEKQVSSFLTLSIIASNSLINRSWMVAMATFVTPVTAAKRDSQHESLLDALVARRQQDIMTLGISSRVTSRIKSWVAKSAPRGR
jgi:hypothetical protein